MKTQICDAPGCGAPAMGDDVAFWSGNLCGRCWTDKYTPSHLRDPVAAYPVERRETIRWLRGVVASMVVAVMMAFGMPTTSHAESVEVGDWTMTRLVSLKDDSVSGYMQVLAASEWAGETSSLTLAICRGDNKTEMIVHSKTSVGHSESLPEKVDGWVRFGKDVAIDYSFDLFEQWRNEKNGSILAQCGDDEVWYGAEGWTLPMEFLTMHDYVRFDLGDMGHYKFELDGLKAALRHERDFCATGKHLNAKSTAAGE